MLYKIQSRRNLGFQTAFNHNVGLVRMTDFLYSSIIWLTQGRYAIVDNEDAEWLSKRSWHLRAYPNKNLFYASGNKRVNGRSSSVGMHRVIISAPDGKVVDHINRNGLDNRKSNLRLTDITGNNRNVAVWARKKLPFKGIALEGKKYLAVIECKKLRLRLGRYNAPEEAAKAYDKAALEMFGEFACTNESLGLFEQRHANLKKEGE